MNPPKAYGADYLVALAIAERADDHGRGCYASDEDIARRANLCHFGELAEPQTDASSEAKAHYRSVRANSIRSAKRSLAKLQKAGVVRDDGASRYGTRNRSICMADLVSDSQSAPVVLPDTDLLSAGGDHMSAFKEHVSAEGDHRSVSADHMSPKPSLEPPKEPSSKSLSEPSLASASSGLSPSSTADAAPPQAHLQVELREEEAELLTLEAQLSNARDPERQRRAIEVQRQTVAELRAQLNVDPAEAPQLVGAAA
jgi:hypothetical protein